MVYIVGGGSGFWSHITSYNMWLFCTGDVRILNTQVPDHHPMSPILLQRTKNMMHTTEDAIRSTRGSDLGLKTVRIQDPVRDMGKVVDVRVQHAFTEAVLDQLAAKMAPMSKGIVGS